MRVFCVQNSVIPNVKVMVTAKETKNLFSLLPFYQKGGGGPPFCIAMAIRYGYKDVPKDVLYFIA